MGFRHEKLDTVIDCKHTYMFVRMLFVSMQLKSCSDVKLLMCIQQV